MNKIDIVDNEIEEVIEAKLREFLAKCEIQEKQQMALQTGNMRCFYFMLDNDNINGELYIQYDEFGSKLTAFNMCLYKRIAHDLQQGYSAWFNKEQGTLESLHCLSNPNNQEQEYFAVLSSEAVMGTATLANLNAILDDMLLFVKSPQRVYMKEATSANKGKKVS